MAQMLQEHQRRATDVASAPANDDGDRTTRSLVEWWVCAYVLLWIYEGALRKWVVPQYGDFIYLAKDLATFLLVFVALTVPIRRSRSRMFAATVVAAIAVAAFTGLQTIALGTSTPVAAAGLLTYTSPLLAAGLISSTASPQRTLADLTRIVLWSAPVLAVVAALQATSPASSVWNRFGTDDARLFTSDGIVRASGTFTSPTGLTCFVTLLVVLVLVGLYQGTAVSSRRLTAMSAVAAAVLLGVGGSRGALIAAAVVALAAVAYSLSRTQQLGSSVVRLAGLAIVGVVLYRAVGAAFPEILEAFRTRVENASRSESTVDRIVFSAFGYLDASAEGLGAGVGVHTNAGVALGSQGPWIENELQRWAAEMGVAGILLAVARQVLTLLLIAKTFAMSVRRGTPDAFFAAAALAATLIAGSAFSQPSQQGLTAVMLGFIYLATVVGPRRT